MAGTVRTAGARRAEALPRVDGTLTHGRSYPLGPTVVPGGVNFSVFAKGSTGVHVLLFDRVEDATPARVITLDPNVNRTYHYWHAFVPDIGPGQVYAFRIEGPLDPPRGLRFDPAKVLLDPYARCIARPAARSRDAAAAPDDNAASALKSVVVDPARLRLGRRCTATAAVRAIGHLRDARGRVHAASELGRCQGQARHVRGRHRQDSVPARSGHHGCRAPAGLRVRRAGRATRTDECLGLLAGLVLRPAPGLQLAE